MYSDENLEKILNQWLKEADEIEKEEKEKKDAEKES
uniref:Sporulation protein Cse60 n=1 Tax=Siphoviridae sp. ctbxa26 TaxID=2825568 RepID=A0A8S5VEV5_9CAUD|nr:MAG TPA: Sporulation protein Cse60 [Siphoviridae sp. ctbxa26]